MSFTIKGSSQFHYLDLLFTSKNVGLVNYTRALLSKSKLGPSLQV